MPSCQQCVFERFSLSPLDAVYCSKFFTLLHNIETPYFSTLTYMDKVIKSSSLLFCTSESEAAFLGFMIRDILLQSNRWSQVTLEYISVSVCKLIFLMELLLPPILPVKAAVRFRGKKQSRVSTEI